MKNLKIHLVVITSLALLVLNACTKDDGPEQGDPGSPIITEFGEPLGQANEVTIGPEGGTINSSDGLLSVSIPQGALSGSTVISIQAITNHAPLGLGNGYRLGPEGLSFENPLTLTFHYNEELLDSKPAEFLWIVFQEIDGSWNAMLKSALQSDAKTVTVETSHFSDWSLGRFVDLALDPAATEVIKGKTVGLAVTGFSKGNIKDDDYLGVLIPLEEVEGLIFLSKIETSWRIVGWNLNGVKSPVSNSNGSLQSAEKTASYTAPSIVPKPNVVAVTVELETTAPQGTKSTLYLTSNITIIESDLFLKVEFRGQTYIYYQYGAGDAVIEDPNNFSMSVCGLAGSRLNIGGQTFVNNEITEAFGFYFDNPFKGSRGMIGSRDNGNDVLGITIFNPIAHYDISKVTRTPSGDNCEEVINESNHVTMTLTNYLGTSLSQVDGSFTGTLYYSDQSYDIDCKSSTPYAVSGSFRLLLLTQ